MDWRLLVASLGLVLLLSQVERCAGTATVELQLLSFSNPSNRKFDDTCCNVPCTTACHPAYVVCFNDPMLVGPSCNGPQDKLFYFDKALPNVSVSIPTWTGQLPFKIQVYDLQPGYFFALDYITIVFNTTAALPINQTLTYNGARQNFTTQYTLQLSVQCNPNYYGPGCNVSCIATDGVSGHYSCNTSTGAKICNQGWTGTGCNLATSQCASSPPVPLVPGLCQAVDLMFILDSSASVNNINSNNWQLIKTFISSVIQRVTLGPLSFQIGVVTFSDSASLVIPLSFTSDPDTLTSQVMSLPYLGQKTNLRRGLSVARTQGFAPSNGARPGAYTAAVLVYDGEPPTAQFGTLVDEAPRLNAAGVNVFVVSLNYYFNQGASPALVRSIASTPLVDHLWTNLSDWTTLSNTVAPTILANLQDTCMRLRSNSGGASSTTTGTTTPPSTASPTTATPGAGPQPTPDPACNRNGYCSGDSLEELCYCMPGYVGPACQYSDNPCSYSPCNGGTCTPTSNINYSCTCLPGFSGANCSVIGYAVTCSDDPCLDGGSGCAMTTVSPQCEAIPSFPCAEFYYGPNCATFCAASDTCTVGHFTCSASGNEVCLPGWTASNCSIATNYTSTCSPPCVNGGTCFNQGCCCPTGYAGMDCSIVLSSLAAPVSPASSTGSSTASAAGSTTAFSGTTIASVASTGSLFASTTAFTGTTTGAFTGTTTSGVVTGTTAAVTGSIPSAFTGTTTAVTGTNTAVTGTTTAITGTTTAVTGTTASAVTGTTASAVTGSTSSSAASTTSAIAGPPTSFGTAASTMSVLVATSFGPAGGSTVSTQEALLVLIQQEVALLCANCTPAARQQMTSEIYAQLQNSASFADLDSSTTPFYVSPPWQGTGQLANCTVQVEVFKAVLTQVAGNYQLTLTTDYLITNQSGAAWRISDAQYAVLSATSADGILTPTAGLSTTNRQQLLVYGTYLDAANRVPVAEAIMDAFGPSNQAWVAKTNARVAVGSIEEYIGLIGEPVTSFQFWLVSGAANQTIVEETAANITQPAGSTLAVALASRLSLASVILCPADAAFSLADSFGVMVMGRMFRTDFGKFESLLGAYWNQSAELTEYRGLGVKVIAQQPYLLSNGSEISRLVYFVLNSTHVLPNTPSIPAPSSEDLQPIVAFLAADGSTYQLVPSALLTNGTNPAVFPLAEAFSVVTVERGVESTFGAIGTALQEGVRAVAGYETAQVQVVTSLEFFSVEKRVTFSKILFYVINNGSLVDSRANGSEFSSMQQLVLLVVDIVLPTGQPPTYVMEDLSHDTLVSRHSCFSQIVQGSMPDWLQFEADLTSTLIALTPNQTWTTNQLSLAIAYLEELISTSGQMATQVFYIIEEVDPQGYALPLDSQTFPQPLISNPSLAAHLTVKRENGSAYTLVAPGGVVPGWGVLERYVNLFGLYIVERPGQQDASGAFSNQLNALYRARFTGSSVVVTVVILEEFFTQQGASVWRLGYFVAANQTTVWPETQPPVTPSEVLNLLTVTNQGTGSPYTIVLNSTVGYWRELDLFSFTITSRLSNGSLSAVGIRLAQAFKSFLPVYQLASISIKVISTKEVLFISQPIGTYQIYFAVAADDWQVSALQTNPLPSSLLAPLLAQVLAPSGAPYTLWPPVGGSGTPAGFRADWAYSIVLVGEGDGYVSGVVVAATQTCWTQYLGTAAMNINVTLQGMKPVYGAYGLAGTQVYYSATSNGGALLYPVTDPGPSAACLASTLPPAVPAATLYGPGPGAVSRLDDLFSITIFQRLDTVGLGTLRLALNAAWSNSIGETANVTLIGAKGRISDVINQSPVTEVYYSVAPQLLLSQPLSPVNAPPPSFVNLNFTQLQGANQQMAPGLNSLVLWGDRLSVSDLGRVAAAIAASVSTAVADFSITVLSSLQQQYTSSDWSDAIQLSYAAVANGSDLYTAAFISSSTLSGQLTAQGLQASGARTTRAYRLYTLSPAATVRLNNAALASAITSAWALSNPAIGASQFSVTVNTPGSRKKRSTAATTGTTLTYQNLQGNPVTPVEFTVLVGGYNPDPYFISVPSNLSATLTSASLVPACSAACAVTVKQCSVLTVEGSLSTNQLSGLSQAVAAAYGAANQPGVNQPGLSAADFIVTGLNSTSLVDQSGNGVTQVPYCVSVQPTAPVTDIDDVVTPSFGVMSNATSAIGVTLVQPSGPVNATSSTLQTKYIVVIAVLCGLTGLVLLSIGIWMIVVCCKRCSVKRADDRSTLRPYDSDSFIGHGLFNSSPVNSMNKTPGGTVHGKTQYIDAEQPRP